MRLHFGDDAEAPALVLERGEDVKYAVEAGELGELRVVVSAVDPNQLVHMIAIEERHLIGEVRAADAREDLLVGETASQDRLGRVVERAEDHRGGVDERAVEVEEDDRKAHVLDRSRRLRST